ncbi:MAG TPA: triose-phosphate isomerase [Lichenihabitans sp.]|jgi:triosephosphate isomerase|nr:triose-phosphate isomerase [Lichenihabitans sp.]
MAKRPWIGTSWKMNKVRAEARAYAEALKTSPLVGMAAARLFVVPPFPYIADVAGILDGSGVMVGAQNMHWADAGAWTGEVSPLMVRDCGATLVEIGHSERREHFGETDDSVARKVEAAMRHGLLALVCVGDTRAEYAAGETAVVLARQVRAALSRIEPPQATGVLLAYEPVWSIGEGGTPADPGFADEQQRLVKAVTREAVGRELDVLYGGSVNPGNAVGLASRPHVDGLFIGRSAWTAEGYLGIVRDVTESLGRPD